jgi:hypothetical protein
MRRGGAQGEQAFDFDEPVGRERGADHQSMNRTELRRPLADSFLKWVAKA